MTTMDINEYVPGNIAIVGDWHGATSWGRHMINIAARNGIHTIVHAGDFGYKFTRGFRNELNDALVATGIQLFFVDGNHEDFDWLYAQPIGEHGTRQLRSNIHHLPRGFSWTWGPEKWLAFGGAYSVDRSQRELGKSWWRQEVITDEQVAAVPEGKVDVMITHDVPTGVYVPIMDVWKRDPLPYLQDNDNLQSEINRSKLRQVFDKAKPDVLYHGHFHDRYTGNLDRTLIVGLDCNGKREMNNIVFHRVRGYADERAGQDPERGADGGRQEGPEHAGGASAAVGG